MANDGISACGQIKCTGVALHCEKRSVPCIEYRKSISASVCAFKPTVEEAQAEFDNLVLGYCGRTSLKECKCEAAGEPTVEEVWSFTDYLASVWRGFASWIAGAFRSDGDKTAPKNVREYPAPPARQR
mgnify:CR=1 FL=1